MTTNSLNYIDSEEMENLLEKVEESFGIRFEYTELIYVKTFGELSDHISNKIELENQNDCTTQQAFYKLREAISAELSIDKKLITPSLPLSQVLPRKNRRSTLKKLENRLDFEFSILRAPNWVTVTLFIALLISVILVFVNGRIGTAGIAFCICSLWLSNKVGKEMNLKTVGEVAEKMTIDNYLKSRRNPNTFNKTEIEKTLTNLCVEYLVLEKNEVTRETQFR